MCPSALVGAYFKVGALLELVHTVYHSDCARAEELNIVANCKRCGGELCSPLLLISVVNRSGIDEMKKALAEVLREYLCDEHRYLVEEVAETIVERQKRYRSLS